MPFANFYFFAFLIYNTIFIDFQDAKFIDYYHFACSTLGWPVVLYTIFNKICYKYTIEPWVDNDN